MVVLRAVETGTSPQSLNANVMAGERPICPNLQRYYYLSPREKIKYLATPEAQFLFSGLPTEVAEMLQKGFLAGSLGVNILGWEEVVVNYFMANSRIIPALAENPGTFTMLEKMYHFEPVNGVIDNYFLQCKSGGQALYNRYKVVTAKACDHIAEVLVNNGQCLMIDIGSGPGRNAIDICRLHPEFNGVIKIDCIDIDPAVITKGQELIAEFGIKQVEFVQKSMTRLRKRYHGNVGYGLLIGILCGLTRQERVGLLISLKSYFCKGARLVAASLLDKMIAEDLLCAYILRETTGWGLQYPPFGELKEVFEEAGWQYEGYFQDEPTRFYEIGIGVA